MDRYRVISLNSRDETLNFGKEFAKKLGPGTVLALSGDLGTGKTTFVQGIAMGLEISDPIQSPTFVYCNEYEGVMALAHFDLYRLHGVNDFLNLGFEEYLDPAGVSAIEWPERILSLLPDNAIRINFSYQPQGRKLEVYS